MTFAQLCAAAAEPALRRCIDLCAQQGRGYEVSGCRMPAGCLPERVTVGFLRRGEGCLLYWRPGVAYRGNSRVLSALFARNTWGFDTYEAMAGRLYSLRREAGPPVQPYQPPVLEPSPMPARPAGTSSKPTDAAGNAGPLTEPSGPSTGSVGPSAGTSGPPTRGVGPSTGTPRPSTENVGPSTGAAGPSSRTVGNPGLSTAAPPSLAASGKRTASESSRIWPALYLRLRDVLEESVLGQTQAVEAAAYRIYCHAGKSNPSRPLSLIFHGPTGVGKSELGKALAPALERCCGHRYQSVWTELNTFTQAHSVHRLTGAPPGYVGYEDPPVFEAVRQNPYTVFFFDELEKAHPEVLKVFMSILDEGRCSAHRADGQGQRELDFRHCVFAFTTNANLSAAPSRTLGFSDETPPVLPDAPKTAASPMELAKRLFQENEWGRQAMVRLGVLPEIAGRFGGIIGFRELDASARIAVTVKQIRALGREYGLEVAQVDPETAKALTPGPDALSIRSSVCVLESLLAPLFSDAHGLRRCRLSGPPDALRLSYCGISNSSTVLLATS